MLSEIEQRRVWEGMLGAETRANYFADYATRYQRWQKWLTFGSIVLSSSSAASFALNLSPYWARLLAPALALSGAIVAAFSLAWDVQKLATEAANLHHQQNILARDFQELWCDMYADRAADDLRRLETRASELSRAALLFPNDVKAMERWEEHVVMHHAAGV